MNVTRLLDSIVPPVVLGLSRRLIWSFIRNDSITKHYLDQGNSSIHFLLIFLKIYLQQGMNLNPLIVVQKNKEIEINFFGEPLLAAVAKKAVYFGC